MTVLYNTIWHNKLTDQRTSSIRSWCKELIVDWRRRHNIPLLVNGTKAELIELAFSNLPEKCYATDELTATYTITMLR